MYYHMGKMSHACRHKDRNKYRDAHISTQSTHEYILVLKLQKSTQGCHS